MLGRAVGPAPARARPQPRSAAGAGRAAAAVRSARSARSAARRESPDDIDAVLVGLVDRVTRRMRAADRVGRTVVLRLRFDDFSRATRSHTLPRATAQTPHDPRDRPGAARTRPTPMIEQRGLTLVGISVANLDDDDAVQLGAAVRPPERQRARRRARRRARPVRLRRRSPRAVLLGRDHGLIGAAAPRLTATSWRLPSR